jgi:hypothetical protein
MIDGMTAGEAGGGTRPLPCLAGRSFWEGCSLRAANGSTADAADRGTGVAGREPTSSQEKFPPEGENAQWLSWRVVLLETRAHNACSEHVTRGAPRPVRTRTDLPPSSPACER